MSIDPQRQPASQSTRPTPDEHGGAFTSVLEALAAAPTLPACWWFGLPWWRSGRRGPR